MYVADITDTERICLRYLSRIDDKALALQCQIEYLEVKTVVRGILLFSLDATSAELKARD